MTQSVNDHDIFTWNKNETVLRRSWRYSCKKTVRECVCVKLVGKKWRWCWKIWRLGTTISMGSLLNRNIRTPSKGKKCCEDPWGRFLVNQSKETHNTSSSNWFAVAILSSLSNFSFFLLLSFQYGSSAWNKNMINTTDSSADCWLTACYSYTICGCSQLLAASCRVTDIWLLKNDSSTKLCFRRATLVFGSHR